MYRLVLTLFAALCFATSFYLDLAPVGAEKPETQSLNSAGGEFGPIRVTRDNRVYQIKVRQNLSIPYNSNGISRFIGGEILDEQKNFLMAFGNDVWIERDSEGIDSKKGFDIWVTFPQKGVYYLRFTSENGDDTAQPAGAEVPEDIPPDAAIDVSTNPKAGNPSIHFFIGFITIIILGVVWYLKEGRDNKNKKAPGKKGKRKSSSGNTRTSLVNILIWVIFFGIAFSGEYIC